MCFYGHCVSLGGGASKGLVHNLLMQSFALGSSNIEVPKLIFLIS